MIDDEQRRQDFILATDLLGGQRAAAKLLDISERSVRNLVNGTHPVHSGFMRDITAALRDHARACTDLARRTDPLFTANRTAAELKDPVLQLKDQLLELEALKLAEQEAKRG